MTDTDTTAAVAAALANIRESHTEKTWYRTSVSGEFIPRQGCSLCLGAPWPCAAVVLAQEVERLTRLHDACPPYRIADWTPADLAALIERDRAILVQMTHAANRVKQ